MPYKNKIKIYQKDTYYHLYARGLDKMSLFKSQKDYKYFELLLEKYLTYGYIDKRKYGNYEVLVTINSAYEHIELNCYTLMPNHFHLLCKTKTDTGITILMQRVLSVYSKYFNKKYKRRGTILEGSYRAVLIETERQLVHVSRYIHLNPLKDGLVKRTSDYAFSSYKNYLMNDSSKKWLKLDPTIFSATEYENIDKYLGDRGVNGLSL